MLDQIRCQVQQPPMLPPRILPRRLVPQLRHAEERQPPRPRPPTARAPPPSSAEAASRAAAHPGRAWRPTRPAGTNKPLASHPTPSAARPAASPAATASTSRAVSRASSIVVAACRLATITCARHPRRAPGNPGHAARCATSSTSTSAGRGCGNGHDHDGAGRHRQKNAGDVGRNGRSNQARGKPRAGDKRGRDDRDAGRRHENGRPARTGISSSHRTSFLPQVGELETPPLPLSDDLRQRVGEEKVGPELISARPNVGLSTT